MRVALALGKRNTTSTSKAVRWSFSRTTMLRDVITPNESHGPYTGSQSQFASSISQTCPTKVIPPTGWTLDEPRRGF
jgi:hypothetical protein